MRPIVNALTDFVNTLTARDCKVPDMQRKSLAERAKMARERAGFRNEAAAARAIGCSRTLIIRWETDAKSIGSAYLLRAAEVYKVSPAWLSMQADDDRYPWSPGDDTGSSQSVSEQREKLIAAMKLMHLVRDRSIAPLTPEIEERVGHAALDVVLEIGARKILDGAEVEPAYGKVMELMRSGG